MNKQETAEAIIVMQAWIDGAEIEGRFKDSSDWTGLETCELIIWNFDKSNFRIKLSPREFWIWTSEDGRSLWRETYGPQDTDRDAIKVREVLE